MKMAYTSNNIIFDATKNRNDEVKKNMAEYIFSSKNV